MEDFFCQCDFSRSTKGMNFKLHANRMWWEIDIVYFLILYFYGKNTRNSIICKHNLLGFTNSMWWEVEAHVFFKFSIFLAKMWEKMIFCLLECS